MNVTLEQIKGLVEEPYFSRGEKYFKDRMIKISSVSEVEVKAKVLGSVVYAVELFLKNEQLDGRCSCPAFHDIGPCKHIAAVGIALIAHKKGKYQASFGCVDQIDEYEKFETVLKSKSKNELISIILRMSSSCPEIIYELIKE